MKRLVVLVVLAPTIALAEPWSLGTGITLSQDGSRSEPGQNPTSHESDDVVLSYFGALAEASRTTDHLRFRVFATGGQIDSYGTHGWFAGVGGGVDLQICRLTCFGIGLAASEQLLDYKRDYQPTFEAMFSARFVSLVVHASAFVAMPIGHFSLTARVGPRRKWIHSGAYDNEDDPQPGLGGELVLSHPLR